MTIQEKIELLRRHETYCYQICYFLLQNERLSEQAAETALLQVAGDARFFTDSDETRRRKAKRASVSSSLSSLAGAARR